MDTISRETYAIPVYAFDDIENWDGDAKRPEDSESDRLIVRHTERQTGPDHIDVREERNGSRVTSFDFRITDPHLHRVSYTGEETPPVYVLHAIHDFGYGITNVPSLGRWFTNRWEAQHFLGQLVEKQDDITEPFITHLIESTTFLIDTIDTVLTTRYGTSDAEFEEIRSSYTPTDEDVLALSAVKDHYWDAAHDHNLEHLFGSMDGSKRLNVGLSVSDIEAGEDSYLSVDLATEHGIERFLFHKQTETRCAYVPDTQSNRPHPGTVTLLHDEGYEVTNATTVALADTLFELVEYGVVFLKDLQQTELFGASSDDYLTQLVSTAYDHSFSILQALALRDYDAETYDGVTARVRDHFDLTEEEVEEVAHDDLLELLTATARLLPDDAHTHAQEHLEGSLVDTTDVFSDNKTPL